MSINLDNSVNHLFNSPPVHRSKTISQPAEGFDDMLKANALMAKVMANRDAIISQQQEAAPPENKDDIAFIREHGMQAFVEAEHARKIEEMREKLLEAMGLTEESLSEMSGEQRAAIEQTINNEIKRQLAAESMMNEEPSGSDSHIAKNMMFTSVSHLNFGGPAVQAEIMMQEAVTNNINTDGRDRFIRNAVDKENRQ